MDERWWILICCSIIGFTTDFFTEESSTLVQRLTGTASACADGTDYCTYLSVEQFNLIFSTQSVASAVGSILAGFIIDRYGCKWTMIACSAAVFSGGLLFVGSTYIPVTSKLFIVMEVGNTLGGFGGGAATVIMHRIKASWFMYKELTLAFSIHILFARFGSATSYLLIGSLVGPIGLQPCLWIGFGLMTLASIACVVMAYVDERGAAISETSPSNISLTVIRDFFKSLDLLFWCYAAMVFVSYGATATFTANGPNFIAKAYGYSEATASYIAGIVYDISLFGLFFGWLTDRYGRREYWLLASAILLLLAFVFEAGIPHFPAWLLATFIGFGYTIFGPVFWSSIPLLVLPSYVGTAIGFLKFCCYVGIGILTAIAGAVLNAQTTESGDILWSSLVILLLVTTLVGVVFAVLTIYLNAKSGYRLSPSQREREDLLQEILPIFVANEPYSESGPYSGMKKLSVDLKHILINK